MDHPLEIETMVIPMEGWVFLILFDNIIREDQPVHGLGVYQWPIERNKLVRIDHDTLWKYFLCDAKSRDFGINRDNSVRKLEHIRQGVDELILTDHTFRQAPVSNQPLQSPHSRIAVPEV